MGIDNNGILFLGLPVEQVDIAAATGIAEPTDTDWCEVLWTFDRGKRESWQRLTCQDKNGSAYSDMQFVGFRLADSGSYGCEVVPNLAERLDWTTKRFRELFGKEPEVLIMNYQW